MFLHGFAMEDIKNDINDQVIEQLIADNDSCIVAIKNGQEVYFDSSKIISHQNGIFLQTQNGDFFRIPLLFSNEGGCFTILTVSDSAIYPVIKCWSCKIPFNPNIYNKGICPSCGAQN